MKYRFSVIFASLLSLASAPAFADLSCTNAEDGKQALTVKFLASYGSVSLVSESDKKIFSWSSVKKTKLTPNNVSFDFVLDGEPQQISTLKILKSTEFSVGRGRGGRGHGICSLRGGCSGDFSSVQTISALLQIGSETFEFDCNEN